jgi:DNA-binding LacI/PurR family transcriptional regulator
MKKGVTLKDMAIKLNMSFSTVSKALSNDESISQPTKERVRKLAKDWDYVPNEAARHFKQNKSYTLVFIVPDLLDQFYGLAVNGVEKVAEQHQYNVIVSQSHEDPVKESHIVDVMISNRVDGVIVTITRHTQNFAPFQKLINNGIPVVFFSRTPSLQEFDSVSSDNEEGARKAVEFLLKNGHRRIAHLKGPAGIQASHQRLQGYKDALQSADITYDPTLVREIDFSVSSTYAAIEALLLLQPAPTGFFIFKNYVSLDVIHFLKSIRSNAKDIEVVGFGNLPLLQHLENKPSASIEENSFVMGMEAAKLIFDTIDKQEKEHVHNIRHIKVPCELVVH